MPSPLVESGTVEFGEQTKPAAPLEELVDGKPVVGGVIDPALVGSVTRAFRVLWGSLPLNGVLPQTFTDYIDNLFSDLTLTYKPGTNSYVVMDLPHVSAHAVRQSLAAQYGHYVLETDFTPDLPAIVPVKDIPDISSLAFLKQFPCERVLPSGNMVNNAYLLVLSTPPESRAFVAGAINDAITNQSVSETLASIGYFEFAKIAPKIGIASFVAYAEKVQSKTPKMHYDNFVGAMTRGGLYKF